MNTKDTIPILYVGMISCKKKIKKVVYLVLKSMVIDKNS